MAHLATARDRWRTALLPDLASLRLEGCCTDTTLLSGDGETTAAHSLVLGAASPVLCRLLGPGTADAEGRHTLQLPGTTRLQIEAAVTEIYSGRCPALLQDFGLLEMVDNKVRQSAVSLLNVKLEEEEEPELESGYLDPEYSNEWDAEYKDHEYDIDEKQKQPRKKRNLV